jgi:2-amino-4-hydroxy-6-hydroxymethyldihydropteridine diphosphokinase
VAPLYRTEAVSEAPQDPYLNTVALGVTRATPEELLAAAHEIESALGRRREAPGAPRTIDLDLLFVGGERRSGGTVELPHPRLRERRFVLAPLADLEPGLELPPDGSCVRELLAALPDRPWVERLGGGGG